MPASAVLQLLLPSCVLVLCGGQKGLTPGKFHLLRLHHLISRLPCLPSSFEFHQSLLVFHKCIRLCVTVCVMFHVVIAIVFNLR